MKRDTRWFLIALAGLLLLIGPSALRYLQRDAAPSTYTPPSIPTAAIAATPVPTATPLPLSVASDIPEGAIKRGPVVVDLAHFSAIERDRFQPLASALATQGVDLRFWLPTIEMSSVPSFTAFPDQSEALQKNLADASALVVISPFFLYNDSEVQTVERFLADGGRLLVISDPDLESDAARDTNSLAAPFNVVFNEDYLYDTIDNDANYVHFFQGGFFDQAEALVDSRIGFYGGRSIDGAVVPQVRSAATTLSSLRSGQSNFTTVALGGLHANNTFGRVLAMSDFDVLTDPYVTRHDNRRMLQFVVDFLAGGVRNQTIADFPAFFGKQVALVVESRDPVGAQAVSKAAEIQRVLELSGRSLALGATAWLTDSKAASGMDLLYVASFIDANQSTTLLADAGFVFEKRVITPTLAAPGSTPAALETPTPQTPASQADPQPSPAPAEGTVLPEIPPLTPAPDVPLPTPALQTSPLTLTTAPAGQQWPSGPVAQLPTPDNEPETPAPTEEPRATSEATTQVGASSPSKNEDDSNDAPRTMDRTDPAPPTPTVQYYLVRDDGIRLLADETQLFIQRSDAEERKTIAVLGASDAAINAGLTRLLNRDLAGCLVQDGLVICPFVPGASMPATPAAPPTPQPQDDAAPPPAAQTTETPDRTPDSSIVVVDDDLNASAGEIGEAELYAALLIRAGYSAEIWSTAERNYPSAADLAQFGWIIWSDAAYDESGVRGEALKVIGDLINNGGQVTVSSRMPFFGVGAEPASPISDIMIADGMPALVAGLPAAPIALPAGLPAVVPLDRNPDRSTGAVIATRRGPTSEATDAPVLMLYTDENFEDPKGARLLLHGMSLTWLPDDVAAQLVQNMAQVMLEGK
jgi:hypothetical protein